MCGGDLVIYTEDNHQVGFAQWLSGDLVASVADVEARCVAACNGLEYLPSSPEVRALRHAYAITVRKSKGSQF